jgi:hypothetical protein
MAYTDRSSYACYATSVPCTICNANNAEEGGKPYHVSRIYSHSRVARDIRVYSLQTSWKLYCDVKYRLVLNCHCMVLLYLNVCYSRDFRCMRRGSVLVHVSAVTNQATNKHLDASGNVVMDCMPCTNVIHCARYTG